MKCKVEALGDQALVVLEGEVTIQHITALRETLLTSMTDGAGVVVDVSKVTKADLSLLQLLCAAHRNATVVGKPLTVQGGENECIPRTAAEAGYLRKTGCELDSTGTCLWVTGGKA